MTKKITLLQWWDKYNKWIVIGFSFIVICYLIFKYVISDWIDNDNKDLVVSLLTQKKKRYAPKESKGEMMCRDFATQLFGKPFIKIRPDFLRNDQTGHNLELDIYNDELKLAIEYNGIQHYKYIPHFHKNEEAFKAQQYRDKLKEERCRQNGIKLIIVPYTVKHHDIADYLYNEAKKLNIV